MSALQEAKLWIVHWAGLPKDALHIYVGLAVFLIAAALMRRSLGDWRPLAAVLVVALAGEAWDLADTWRAGERVVLLRNWHDVWNTSFWPAILFVLARFTRLIR